MTRSGFFTRNLRRVTLQTWNVEISRSFFARNNMPEELQIVNAKTRFTLHNWLFTTTSG